MEQNLNDKPLSNMQIARYIESLRKEMNFDDEVYGLVKSDLEDGLTQEQTEKYLDIHNGKTMLTFLDTSKDYKLYDEQNRVVTTKKGDELYTHYDKVESSVRERYEKVQKEQKKTTKKKTVTTRKER